MTAASALGAVRRPVFDADHEAFRDSVARFLAAGDRPGWWAAAAEYGFVGLGAAEVEDPRFAAVVLEETMAAGLPHLALSLATHDSFALPLLGREALPAAVVDTPGVRAEPSGAGWTLHGTAEGVVNGLGADMFVVRAVGDASSDLLFAVPGVVVDRVPADPVLGLDDLDLADVRLDGIAVGVTDRLDADLAAARARHQLALAVAAVAGARTALATTVVYVQQRKAFGTPISSFENTRHALGVLGARVAAVERFVDSVLASSAAGGDLLSSVAAAAKLTASEVLGAAVDLGVQLHGGYGYMWEYPIARAYAAARFFRVHGASTADLDDVLAAAVGL